MCGPACRSHSTTGIVPACSLSAHCALLWHANLDQHMHVAYLSKVSRKRNAVMFGADQLRV